MRPGEHAQRGGGWSTSQLIAVLIERLGGGPVTVTLEEMRRYNSPLPTVFTVTTDPVETLVLTVDDRKQ